MKKVSLSTRVGEDVAAALTAAASDELPKTQIIDHALRVELGMIDSPTPELAAVLATDPQIDNEALLAHIRSLDPRAQRWIWDALDGTPDVEPSVSESHVFSNDRHQVFVGNELVLDEPTTPEIEEAVVGAALRRAIEKSGEPTDADVRDWFMALDGIDQERIMAAVGWIPQRTEAELGGEAQPATTDPQNKGTSAQHQPEASAAEFSFESIVEQVEAAPEEVRRDVLERLLGDQLKTSIPIPTPAITFDHIAGEVRTTPTVQSATPGSAAQPDPEVQALADQIVSEQGLDRDTAVRMAARIVARRREA